MGRIFTSFSTTLLKMLVLYLASFPAVLGMILIGLAFYSTIVIFGAPIDYQPDFSAFSVRLIFKQD